MSVALMIIFTDVEYPVLPHSLGREPRNNEQYREWFAGIEGIFKDFTFELFDVVEDEKRGRVAARARSMFSLSSFRTLGILRRERGEGRADVIYCVQAAR